MVAAVGALVVGIATLAAPAVAAAGAPAVVTAGDRTVLLAGARAVATAGRPAARGRVAGLRPSSERPVVRAATVPPAALRPTIRRFGDARHVDGGAMTGAAVAIVGTPSGRGYWVVNAFGRVMHHGDARWYGSVARDHSPSPVVGMAVTPSGAGYWLVTRAGNVWAFGDARWLGSLARRALAAPIVAIAPSAQGNGYYLAAADGQVYAFGRAHGRRRSGGASSPTVAMAATGDDRGYWLVGADGGITTYGDAAPLGSLPAAGVRVTDVVAVAPAPGGLGYWLARAGGEIQGFGAAADHGSSAPNPADRRTVGLLADADGGGYWELSTSVAPPPPPPGPSGTPLGTFSVTCYSGAGTTASGAPTSLQDVAVDPSVIPLGSVIYISNVGVRTAQDTGSAIIGDRLDIWEPTLQQCIDWGRQDQQVSLQS